MKQENLTKIENFTAYVRQYTAGEGEVENALIQGEMLAGTPLSALRAVDSVFENCRFNGCGMHKSRFNGVVFRNCDFSNTNLSDGTFIQCRFEGCKTLGTVFSGSFVRDCHFVNSTMQYANYATCTLQGCTFEDCNLGSANFTECKLKAIQWKNTNLALATFYKTPLKGLDLSDCQIEGIGVLAECRELKGCTMNAAQCFELAELLGIKIK